MDKFLPLVEALTDKLLSEFEKNNIIKKIKLDNNKEVYQLIKKTDGPDLDHKFPGNIVDNINEFTSLIRNIYVNLNLQDSYKVNDYTLSEILTLIFDLKPLTMFEKLEFTSNIESLNKIIDSKSSKFLFTDKKVFDSISSLNEMTLRVLEIYGVKKALDFFSSLGYVQQKRSSFRGAIPDLILLNDKSNYPNLIFEFKYRKKNSTPSSDLILNSLHIINELNKEKPTFFLLIIFTTQPDDANEASKLLFNKFLTDLNIAGNGNKILFELINTNNIQKINELFFNFQEKYLDNDIIFHFENQVPPLNYPERNDHYIERFFDFKKTDFEIQINPIETKFWRLGFKFSSNEFFSTLNSPRHSNENADVHINVGYLGTNKWMQSGKLDLMVYNAQTVSEENTFKEYLGQPVTLKVKTNNITNLTDFEVFIDEQLFLKKIIDLNKYNFCQLSAWCDYYIFKLKVKIKLFQKSL